MPADATLEPTTAPAPAAGTCSCDADAPALSAPVDAVVACTLGPSVVAERVEAWAAVAARAVGRERIHGGLALRFAPIPGLAGEMADLAVAEQSCCAFFRFAVVIEADALTLEVRAPAGAEAVVDALFPGTSTAGV